MGEVEHVYETYNDIHNIIAKSAAKIAEEFKPDMLIAIGSSSHPAEYTPADLNRRVC